MQDPRSTTPQSIMPAYPWLARDRVDWRAVGRGVAAQVTLGVPYTRDAAANAAALAKKQGQQIAGEIVQQGGPAGLEATKVVALIAYLQRLGTDIKQTTATAAGAGGSGR
jgi:cytochrome c oxidase cbb3-type subunit I/II